jgi:protein-S-isoprenylcysteine O-methyltransferase Ste14
MAKRDAAHSAASRAILGRVQKRRKLRIRVVAAIGLLILPFVASRWPDQSAIHEGLEQVGLLLIVACILGRAWCTLYIGGRKAHELVELGPYSVSRNPLYLLSFAGTLGLGLLSGSMIVGLVFLLAALAVFVPVVRREEEILRSMFGPPYEAYTARVPRFLPAISAWKDAETISFSPPLFYMTLRDGLVFLLAAPIFGLIEILQRSQVLPRLLILP